MTQELTLIRSEKYALNDTLMNPVVNVSTVCPFNTTYEPALLNVSIQKTFTPTIQASADYQGIGHFRFSLTSPYITVYE